jgi:hypothetical protein
MKFSLNSLRYKIKLVHKIYKVNFIKIIKYPRYIKKQKFCILKLERILILISRVNKYIKLKIIKIYNF